MREREFLPDSCLKRKSDVIFEPNDDMRAKFIGQKEFKNLKVHSGTAENTLQNKKLFLLWHKHFIGLSGKFKTECRRALKKDGKAVLVWKQHIRESGYCKWKCRFLKILQKLYFLRVAV